jgi:hypothetical protein
MILVVVALLWVCVSMFGLGGARAQEVYWHQERIDVRIYLGQDVEWRNMSERVAYRKLQETERGESI